MAIDKRLYMFCQFHLRVSLAEIVITDKLSLVLLKKLAQDCFPPFIVFVIDIYDGLALESIDTPWILFVFGLLIMLSIASLKIFEIQSLLEAIIYYLWCVTIPVDH